MIAGILLGLGASACWALANVAIQRSARRLGALPALLWAQLVGIVSVAPFAPLFDIPTQVIGPWEWTWLAVAGGAALLAYVSLFYAFEHGRLTIAVPVMSSWSVLSTALSLLMFDERVRGLQLVGAAVVVAGALTVSRYAQSDGGARRDGGPRWLLASVSTAVGFGILIPLMGRLAPAAGSLGTIAFVYAVDIVLGLPLAARFKVALDPPRGADWLPVILAGLFETGGFVCIVLGGRVAPLALVSPLASLASAFTVAYAWTILRERPPTPVLLGAALACGGVVLLAL